MRIRQEGLRKRKESDLQISVADWLRRQYPNALWTISPSGMKLGKRVAMRFKAMGYRKGTPDIMIFEPRGNWHGAFIELKMPKGRASEEQINFSNEAGKRGYYSYINQQVKTEQEAFEGAIGAIKYYMELDKTQDVQKKVGL